MSFLTAEWRKLAIANYEVSPELLQPFVPKHTQLDLWNNRCYVSLVGFMFLNTRLRGLPIPFHRNFEEVNLRFYVTHDPGDGPRRGVVFIKEVVPRRGLTFVANTVYREHYQTLPMKHTWQTSEQSLDVAYQWKFQKHWHGITVHASPASIGIEEDSEEAFITEHYWGYTKADDRTTYEYEVTHPPWEIYPVRNYEIDVDFGALYGEAFADLINTVPTSVMLAEGSPITVETKRKL